MWLSGKKKETPDFGFRVEVRKKLGKGKKVYAGHGLRVVEMNNADGNSFYQLRMKAA